MLGGIHNQGEREVFCTFRGLGERVGKIGEQNFHMIFYIENLIVTIGVLVMFLKNY